jgi:muramoyltetrapeptide carboxypeptidase LdcA involved in peptidoglycan recycling
MPLVRPRRLVRGDTVAVLSLSAGTAADIPHRYEAGKRQVEETFGLRVIEAPHALRDSGWLYDHPQARAEDLVWALEHPEVKGIISAIGGHESVRILPFVDPALVARHPKIFMGFSDTTVQHVLYGNAGVVSFYGPSLLTGLAENGGISVFTRDAIERTLFRAEAGELEPAPAWTEEFLDWRDPANQQRRRTHVPNPGWVWLQGGESPAVTGHLMGGCLEVLEMLKGTMWWPGPASWAGAVVHFELSEVAPQPSQVEVWLRNYASQGILQHLAALLVSRPMRYPLERKFKLFKAIRKVLAEVDRTDMPVVCDLDFGHTSPMGVLPHGCSVHVSPAERRISITEPAVT